LTIIANDITHPSLHQVVQLVARESRGQIMREEESVPKLGSIELSRLDAREGGATQPIGNWGLDQSSGEQVNIRGSRINTGSLRPPIRINVGRNRGPDRVCEVRASTRHPVVVVASEPVIPTTLNVSGDQV